mgnify:CR=1 FL=1
MAAQIHVSNVGPNLGFGPTSVSAQRRFRPNLRVPLEYTVICTHFENQNDDQSILFIFINVIIPYYVIFSANIRT